MRKIIDFHTHAFPDALADKAMVQLHSELHCELYGRVEFKAYLDGKIRSLLTSMDKSGIEKSVLCCIATRPSQFEPIFQWCMKIRSDRIIPLPSVHPDDPQAVEKIQRIANEGFKGLKFHPYYQEFDIDSPKIDYIYEAISANRMLVVMHTGYDIAFEKVDRAGPIRILNVIKRFPHLKFITTHMGAWYDWDTVEQEILGRPIYLEISVSRALLGPRRFRDMLIRHPQDYLLFGTDSPWSDQDEEIEAIRRLDLPEKVLNRLFYENAKQLIDS
jgi:predicted TIM-barrel fold metal-dependent hydrolase